MWLVSHIKKHSSFAHVFMWKLPKNSLICPYNVGMTVLIETPWTEQQKRYISLKTYWLNTIPPRQKSYDRLAHHLLVLFSKMEPVALVKSSFFRAYPYSKQNISTLLQARHWPHQFVNHALPAKLNRLFRVCSLLKFELKLRLIRHLTSFCRF